MTKLTTIRGCGYVGITCSVLLGVATVWAYASFHSALGTLAQSLRETTQSAAIVLDQIATTTKERVDVAEQYGPDVEVEPEAGSRPETGVREAGRNAAAVRDEHEDAAASTYDLAGSVTVVANSLSIQVPVRVAREGLIPVIVWGTPFDAPVNALKLFAERSASLGASL